MSKRKSDGPSLGLLLIRAARLFDEQAVARIEAVTNAGLRTSHTALVMHLELLERANESKAEGEQGVRLTDLADAMGITKQAVGQLVEDLARHGVLKRVIDPRDRRARLVELTARGERAKQHGLSVLRGLEGEAALFLGRSRVDELKEDLLALLDFLEGD
jgi:DNA-binding MarR family transcriptional regulator